MDWVAGAPFGYRGDRQLARGEHQVPVLPQSSPRHNTTDIGAMEDALSAIESLGKGGKFTYKAIADRYGVNRSTLSRRHRGVNRSVQEYAVTKQLLSPDHEEELVKYIIRLTERGLPPTKEFIQTFAGVVFKKVVGEGWVLRFVERHKDTLITK
jgi:hypothetical protein